MCSSFKHLNAKEVALTVDKYVQEKNFVELERYIDSLRNSLHKCEESMKFALYYYIATGYSELSKEYGRKNVLNQSKCFRELSFSYYRSSIAALRENQVVEGEYVGPQRVMILTNYAMALFDCGRAIEAIRVLRTAIKSNPRFAMAQANYGGCLSFYAYLCNTKFDQNILYHHAILSIKKALVLNDPNMYSEAREYFQKISNTYNEKDFNYRINNKINQREANLGRSKEERSYRVWCLQNHLFLTPLNDLLEIDYAFAEDSLTISQCTDTNTKEPPKWFAMINQLKQEFVYLRYLYYESLKTRKSPHFADKRVFLTCADYNYANYSVRLEQLKHAFKNIFSIFDQVAFVVNLYWKLGLKDNEASAYNVFKKNKRLDELTKDNWGLQALYWSYREFCEKYNDSSKPYEADLKILRNALEHKFVKVVLLCQNNEPLFQENNFYYIQETTLREYTLRLLELTREWIIELVYAINIEEKKKNSISGERVELYVQDFPENWKL